MAVMCKDYKPKDPTAKENCPNCHVWAEIRCLNHSKRVNGFHIDTKFDASDKAMRSNKGLYLG